MNITDIDDKIIKRARQNYLYEQYVSAAKSLEQILDDHKHVLNQLNDVIQKNTDPDKKVLLDRSLQQYVSLELHFTQTKLETNSLLTFSCNWL